MHRHDAWRQTINVTMGSGIEGTTYLPYVFAKRGQLRSCATRVGEPEAHVALRGYRRPKSVKRGVRLADRRAGVT
jgi:hypothetical protein